MFDTNDNGFITIDEYKIVVSSYNVTEEVATKTFPKLDSNGDGRISKEEFVELIKQFHMSDDPDAPGNLFFGAY